MQAKNLDRVVRSLARSVAFRPLVSAVSEYYGGLEAAAACGVQLSRDDMTSKVVGVRVPVALCGRGGHSLVTISDVELFNSVLSVGSVSVVPIYCQWVAIRSVL